MNKISIAIATAVALALAVITPATAANAAAPVVTGIVTVGGAPVPSATVGWVDPATGATSEQSAAADGSYSLALPATPYVLYANLHHDDSGWHTVDNRYVGVFFGDAGARDYLYQSLTPYPAATLATTANLGIDLPATISGSAAHLAKKYIDAVDLDGNIVTSVKADATGAFVFSHVIPGNYQLRTDAVGPYTAWLSPELTLAAGQSAVVNPAPIRGGVLTGVVTSKGKPVKGVVVSALSSYIFGGSVLTNSHGRYRLAGLGSGRYAISVGGPVMHAPQSSGEFGDKGTPGARLTTTHKQVVVGRTATKNVHVKRGAAVTMHVHLPAKSDSYTVTLLDHRGTHVEGDNGAAGTTNPVTFFGLASGRYSVYITDNASKRYAKRTFRVKAGATTQLGTVAPDRATVTFSGTVAGATSGDVQVATKAGSVFATIGSSGRFTVGGIVPGKNVVTVQTDTTVDRSTTVSMVKSRSKALATGAQLVPVTATLMVGDAKLESGNGRFDRGDSEQFFTVAAGVLRGSTFPGASKLALDDAGSPFVDGSPFWLELPAASTKLSAVEGTTLALGNVTLDIRR